MNQEYFVVVLAHSLRGRLRRIHIPHKFVYAILALALVGCVSVVGFVASYARMAWKVANYNNLKRETDGLRDRYQALLKSVNQTNEQMASLQLLAKEVAVAYGVRERLGGPADISSEGRLAPTVAESLEDYDYLRGVRRLSLAGSAGHRIERHASKPSIWPIEGRLMSAFGHREDPFSGEQAFHAGVDISAAYGSPVHATADGIVVWSDWDSGYGRLVVVDHGGGVQTYYAHLSKSLVHLGQEVRRTDEVGLVGATGRVTAPHLHYEVRQGGSPVNPYTFHLGRMAIYDPPPATDKNYLLF
jgi:murein DD-endopeptidase MepM/ murein hydrolase activator NlpD